MGDSAAAFLGATLGRPGVLVICGTGTSIIACNEAGEFTQLTTQKYLPDYAAMIVYER